MKCFKVKKLNNDGAALIFAIVVVMFITILTTMLLYAATMNFEMKTTDYRTKVSFYGAEIPLEELRVQMAVDASQASKVAYEQVLTQYGVLSTEEMRQAEYQRAFMNEIEDIWEARLNVGAAPNWAIAVKEALKLVSPNVTDTSCTYDIRMNNEPEDNTLAYHIVFDAALAVDPGDSTAQLFRDEAKGRMILQDVYVMYTKNNFTSVITTDICITIPELEWGVNTFENPTTYVAGSDARTKYDFEKCVTYLNWQKQ